MRKMIFALAALSVATAAQAGWLSGGDCEEDAARSAVQSAAGVTRVVIIGRAGFLHIDGHSGAREVRATGTACAANQEMLAGVNLSGTRSGSEVRIEAIVPEHEGSFFGS